MYMRISGTEPSSVILSLYVIDESWMVLIRN